MKFESDSSCVVTGGTGLSEAGFYVTMSSRGACQWPASVGRLGHTKDAMEKKNIQWSFLKVWTYIHSRHYVDAFNISPPLKYSRRLASTYGYHGNLAQFSLNSRSFLYYFSQSILLTCPQFAILPWINFLIFLSLIFPTILNPSLNYPSCISLFFWEMRSHWADLCACVFSLRQYNPSSSQVPRRCSFHTHILTGDMGCAKARWY